MKSAQVPVTTTPVMLHKGDHCAMSTVLVRNVGPGSVFVGGTGVTALNGYEIAPGDEPREYRVWAYDELWAVRKTSGTSVVHVLANLGS